MSDERVWQSFFVALAFGAGCFALGIWATRRVGLLRRNAPIGETLGVGLGAGLLILASLWATVGSLGRSSFTPIALAFLIALAATLQDSISRDVDQARVGRTDRFPRPIAAILAAGFILGVGLTYGSTMAPSPIDGAQPVEHRDEAFYSVLAADLNINGVESISYPSGFDSIEGLASQNWFHWGEVWLSAAVIRVSGLDPVLARHYVVLPLLLLAAAALTGTLVRSMARTSSRGAFLIGAAASMLLAPVPLLAGAFSGWWPAGLLYGITQYGLAVIAALLILHAVSIDHSRRPSPALALFSGAVVASLLPTHVVVAVLAIVGAGGVFFAGAIVRLVRRHGPVVDLGNWLGTITAVVGASIATVMWGFLTGHSLGAVGSSTIVEPFNRVWVAAVVGPALAGGAFLAIPLAWFMRRDESPKQAAVFLGTMVLVTAGAVVWGSRIADFDMFHIFFGAIAVFAIPVAAVAAWVIVDRFRRSGRPRLATMLIILLVVQLEIGILPAVARLQQFGPGRGYQPIPLDILAMIRNLPPDAKLAYACRPDEEEAFWNPALVSITAHTGRRVVPMCYEEDVFSGLIGANRSVRDENPFFRWAPQRNLYPDETTIPAAERIAAFLRAHNVRYIYSDMKHPNTLVPGAVRLMSENDVALYRTP